MTTRTIGRAARQAGVGVETIRFYERKGLIAQPPRPLGPGFRVYPMETVQRVRFIRQAQEIGFSLCEIDELLSLRADPSASGSDVRRRTIAKRHEVEGKIARLQEILGALDELISACPGEGALGRCSIMETLIGAGRKEDAARRPGRKRLPD
jgi:MerR family mercuric resistance operon transcriptional regulator